MQTNPRGFRFLALFAASGFAIAQPIFDIYTKTPEYFVIQRYGFTEAITLVLGALLIVPGVLFAVEEISDKLSKHLSWLLHKAFITALLATFFLPLIAKHAGTITGKGYGTIVASVIVGAMVLWFFGRKKSAVKIPTIMAWGPVIFGVFFLFNYVSANQSAERRITAASKIDGAKASPLFLIIFDEFPLIPLLDSEGNINAKRFPNFSALSHMATWYRNGTSVCSWTERAVPTILSGRYPDEKKKQLPHLKDYPQNIFTLLSKSHQEQAYEQVTHLCPDAICTEADSTHSRTERLRTLIEDAAVVFLHYLLPEQFRSNLPDISYQWGNFVRHDKEPKKVSKKGLLDKGEWSDDEWLFNHFLAGIEQSSSNPTLQPFHMVHITFPHVPYRYLPDGRQYVLNVNSTNAKGYKKRWAIDDEWPSAVAMQRFMLQAAYADTLVGRFIEVLKKKNLFDQSMVVITADHGSSFQPGEFSRRVSSKNFMDIMSIPLFIKFPDQREGGSTDANVESVDILPTILDANGLRAERPMDGISVFEKSKPKHEKRFYHLEKEKPFEVMGEKIPLEPTFSRVTRLFDQQGFNARFFSLEPSFTKLVGNYFDTVAESSDKRFRLKIQNAEEYSRVDIKNDYLPVLMTGSVIPKDKTNLIQDGSQFAIAVAVNNVVVATVGSEPASGNQAKFSMLIPPDSLSDGKNKIQAIIFLMK